MALEKGHWRCLFSFFLFLSCFFVVSASENKLKVLKNQGEGTGGPSEDSDLTAGLDVEFQPGVSLCESCKTVIKDVLDILGKNESKVAIENALHKVCDKYFSGYKKVVCHTFVRKYTPRIITFLEEHDTPATVCQKLGLCGHTFLHADLEVELGKKIMEYVLDILGNDRSKDAIEKDLCEVCKYFKGYKSCQYLLCKEWGRCCDAFLPVMTAGGNVRPTTP